MIKHLYELKSDLDGRNIFFCFIGPMSQHLLTDIVSVLTKKMSMEQASRSTVLRVFSVVVEKAQNIIRYSAEVTKHDNSGLNDEKELPHGIITVGYEDNHYFVWSGNIIDNSRVDHLRKKLTKLQGMNKEELKQYYQEQRRQGPEEGSKGAGLGFIEMARKASKPIEFDFKQIDEKRSFFSLKTII